MPNVEASRDMLVKLRVVTSPLPADASEANRSSRLEPTLTLSLI
jgi:hypothetical protein